MESEFAGKLLLMIQSGFFASNSKIITSVCEPDYMVNRRELLILVYYFQGLNSLLTRPDSGNKVLLITHFLFLIYFFNSSNLIWS
ncbi:hypothetical protein CLV31_11180 [Algoriphagus aquaeductus]|uniref:Uncharacterized protein n=1 Tax=Algoriphagus aquaeductus TaxID=475299 RepID=A0A326RPE0_9BACT|nr:hypothetical protein CLV31_11180 [Algoriphagus aquaeductus]